VKHLASTVAAVAAVTGFGASPASAQITLDWVTVGNAGNAPDPTTGFGAVGYEYRIGTYEVTNAQYAAFLNSIAASDPNGLYSANMGSDARGGITRSGSDGSYTYAVKPNMGDKPVNFVSWYDAARMANWMTNGQGAGSTESGAYTFQSTFLMSDITRDLSNPNQVFIPTEDEWYKAAYHHPAAQGGDADDYWLYATQSNTVPTVASATATGDIANPGQEVVNYLYGADWNGLDGNVTTVGSAGSTSFYGAFDMAGNVIEWNEGIISGSLRTFRGGAWGQNENGLRADVKFMFTPSGEGPTAGFRLASPIPGPGSGALLAFGGVIAARRRR
jgi:formylglycine-generating enzyme required for sulfatase activity